MHSLIWVGFLKMWLINSQLDDLGWCISSVVSIGERLLSWILVIGICIFVFVLLPMGRFSLIPLSSSWNCYLELGFQRGYIMSHQKREEENINDEIDKLQNDIIRFECETMEYEKRFSGIKGFTKDTFVVSITSSRANNKCILLRVLVKEMDVVKSYLIPIFSSRKFSLLDSEYSLSFVIHYMNGYFLLKLNKEVSCKMAYFVMYTVLRCLKHVRRTDIIRLLVDNYEIPHNNTLLVAMLHYRPITMIIESSQTHNPDRNNMSIEYTPKTIDSFLSRKWFYPNTNVVLNLS